jgi:hypothetical protein
MNIWRSWGVAVGGFLSVLSGIQLVNVPDWSWYQGFLFIPGRYCYCVLFGSFHTSLVPVIRSKADFAWYKASKLETWYYLRLHTRLVLAQVMFFNSSTHTSTIHLGCLHNILIERWFWCYSMR